MTYLDFLFKCENRRYTKDLLFTRILDIINKYPESISLGSTTMALVEIPPVQIKPEKVANNY